MSRRADAARNRESVIAAADAVFTEQGIEAGVPEVAERAGVGKGTVYRNFETKDDLIAAVLTARINDFNEEARVALEHEDAIAALRDLLRETACGKTKNGGFGIGFDFDERHEDYTSARRESQKLLGEMLRKAKRQGTVKKDVRVEDLSVLFGGVARVLNERNIDDIRVWHRHIDHVIDALRS